MGVRGCGHRAAWSKVPVFGLMVSRFLMCANTADDINPALPVIWDIP